MAAPRKWFQSVVDLQAEMGDSVNADGNRKEENKDQAFFNGDTLKSLKVYNNHHKSNEKKESMDRVRSNRRMEQVHLAVLKRWWEFEWHYGVVGLDCSPLRCCR